MSNWGKVVNHHGHELVGLYIDSVRCLNKLEIPNDSLLFARWRDLLLCNSQHIAQIQIIGQTCESENIAVEGFRLLKVFHIVIGTLKTIAAFS